MNEIIEAYIMVFFTTTMAADYLSVSKSTIYRWVETRKIKHYKVNKKTIYFKKEDLDKFIFNPKNVVEPVNNENTSSVTEVITNKIYTTE